MNAALNPVPVADASTDTAAKDRVRAQAAGAAEKFEAHFIKKMMEQMRASSRALSEQDGASHEHFNDDMLDVADGLVADALAHQHAFGIADLMLRSVLPPAAPSASASGDLSSAVAASPSPINTSSTAQESKR